jgi:hypothetical protein
MASPAQIINPLTPLAYLPPDLADQLEASRYLYVATLGVSSSIRCHVNGVRTQGFYLLGLPLGLVNVDAGGIPVDNKSKPRFPSFCIFHVTVRNTDSRTE